MSMDTDDSGDALFIVRNSAICLTCGDEVESRDRHDFRQCKCGAIFVDGGHDYLRRGGDPAVMEDTSIVVPDEPRTHELEHSGEMLEGVHHSALCAGRPCTIHNRSQHRLRSWPQVWIKGRVMRGCPHHIAHADPDEPGRKRCIGCDGCCR